MEMSNVLKVVEAVLIIILGGLSLYFKNSVKAQAKAKEIQVALDLVKNNTVKLITDAEKKYKDISKSGGQKFEYVVNRLYELVPEPLRGIITKNMVEEIVQSTFDEVAEFVRTQLDEKMK